MMGTLLAVLLAATTPPLPQTIVQDLPTDATATNSGAALSVACTDANINACGANSTLELAMAGFLGAGVAVTTSTTLVGVLAADCSYSLTSNQWKPTFFYNPSDGRQRTITVASGAAFDNSIFPCSGARRVRLRLQVVTSGTIPTSAATLTGTMHNGRALTSDELAVPTYAWSIPKAAAAASKLYADLFNASGSGKIIKVRGIFPVAYGNVAVAGVISVRIDIYRTSAVGTGGTAFVYKSATLDVAGGAVSPMDTNAPALPSQITGRAVPTAGATIAEWIDTLQCFTEETSAQTYICSGQTNMSDAAGLQDAVQRRTLREGQGLLIKEDATASPIGNIGFKVLFTVE